MKKRTLSFFLFGFLTLSLVAVSAALYIVDWNQYRDTLAGLVSERLGVRVELAGDLNLSLLPRPTVTAKSVRLSPLQAGFNETIATAAQIDMHLGLMAALGGSIELQSLALEGAEITLMETGEGWRIQGWPEGGPEVNGDTSESDTSALLSLNRFRIKSGAVTLQRASGMKTELKGLDVGIEGTLPGGPVDWDGAAFIAGEAFTLSGRIVPVKSTGETSLRAKLGAAGASAEFSGRLGDGGDVTGRLQGEAKSLAAVKAFVDTVIGQKSAVALPEMPAAFDVQVEKTRHVSSIVSRQLSIGETRGTMELTLVERPDDWHITGRTTFGIVDAAQWLTDNQHTSETVPSNSDLSMKVSGSVDLVVEGVKYKDDLIQQIEAVIAFGQDGVVVSQARALLPGASRVSYAAHRNFKGGDISFESGRLPEIFKWIGFPLSTAVPAGRLTTAAITGQLAVTDGAWFLSDVSGTVDTSKVTAEFSGDTTPFSTSAARVRIDNINLDAYWPDPVFSGGDSELDLPELELDLRVDKLHWQRTAFRDVSIQGTVRADSVAISGFKAAQGESSLTGSLAAHNLNDPATDIAAEIKLVDWMFPVTGALFPETIPVLDQFAGGHGVTGTVVANGPLSKMQGQIKLKAGENEVQLAGTAGLKEEWQFDLQGNLKHDHTTRLLGLANSRTAAEKFLAAAVNLNVSGSVQNITFRVNGILAGDQFDVAGQYSPSKINVGVTLSGNRLSQKALVDNWGPYASIFQADVTRRVRFDLNRSGTDLIVSELEYRNGSAAVTGDFKLTDARVAGNINAVNWSLADVSRLPIPQSRTSTSSMNYSGLVAVSLADFDLEGQKLSAPRGALNFSGDEVLVNLGEGATLNQQPVLGSLAYQFKDEAVSVDVQTVTIDLGALLSSLGAAGGVSGTVQSSLSLKASGHTPKAFLASATGQASFEGSAGTLNFLDVPKLVAALTTAERKTSFLTSLGTILRGGTTDFAKLEGTLRLDSGVALIEKVTAEGTWGSLTLDGQANLPSDVLNVSGVLDLNQPIDAPNIPVNYSGSLSAPNAKWTSAALEQFGLALMERRLRTKLFGEMEQSEQQAGGVPSQSPGSAVLGTAFDLLSKLRASQTARKQQSEEKTDASPPKN